MAFLNKLLFYVLLYNIQDVKLISFHSDQMMLRNSQCAGWPPSDPPPSVSANKLWKHTRAGPWQRMSRIIQEEQNFEGQQQKTHKILPLADWCIVPWENLNNHEKGRNVRKSNSLTSLDGSFHFKCLLWKSPASQPSHQETNHQAETKIPF